MPNYTIRVYGIWINDNNEVLLSDERIGDLEYTKFPGGGMEAGEGSIDTLKREWREELQVDLETIVHFYATDFYQASAFHDNTQIISIYYLVKPVSPTTINTTTKKNDFSYKSEREESHRFFSIREINSRAVTFPID